MNASFSAGWLQARVWERKGAWEDHGAPAGQMLTTMPATRIGGVFGESSKGGVIRATDSGRA